MSCYQRRADARASASDDLRTRRRAAGGRLGRTLAERGPPPGWIEPTELAMRVLKHDGDPISPQYLKASNASAQPAFADTAEAVCRRAQPADRLRRLPGRAVTGRPALRQLRPGQGPGCVPCLLPLAAVRRQPALRLSSASSA